MRAAAISLLGLVVTLSAGTAHAEDVADSRDHPLISRYPDTEITSYQVSEFREFMVATGPITDVEARDALPPVQRGEGKVTSITYVAKSASVSALQIFKNFESAFEQAGFRGIFRCALEKECGERFVPQLYWYGDAQRKSTGSTLDAPNRRGADQRFFYWSGEAETARGNAVISLLVAKHPFGDFPAQVVLDINEPAAMELGKVTIDLKGLVRDIENTGRAVLSGIVFDLDKATLQATSTDAIKVIADYLKAHPNIDFYVVGHSDSSGTYAYNKDLSEARAKAVMQVLVNEYGIAEKRLSAIGVGPVSPVTSNRAEDGRAANRRVELVQAN